MNASRLKHQVAAAIAALSLIGTAAAEVPVTVPDKVKNSMFWLDAADESTMTKDENNNLQSWQSKSGDKRMANAVVKPVYTPSAYGMPTVDFGSTGNGKDMTYSRFTNIRTVFEVIKIEAGTSAFLLGDINGGGSPVYFHRNDAAYFLADTTYAPIDKVWNSLRRVENFTTEAIPSDGFQVICFTTTRNCCSDSLTRDRNKGAAGVDRVSGRQLSEIILFNEVVSDADRVEITNYLISKWRRIALNTVLSNAVLRYDASRRGNFTFDADNKVTGWKNLGSGGASYDGTVAGNKGTFDWQNGVPVFQMGNGGSGIDLAFPTMNNIRTVFWAMDAQRVASFWLGYVGAEIYDFHNGGGSYGVEKDGLINGDTKIYEDGKSVSNSDIWPLGLHQYTMVLRTNARANRLSNDRNISGRNGGRALSEMIVCTSALESFSRETVQDYLREKWTAGAGWIDESDFVYRRTAASGAWNAAGSWAMDAASGMDWTDGNPAAFPVEGEVSVDVATTSGPIFFTKSVRVTGAATLTLLNPTIYVAEGETVIVSAPLSAASNIIKTGRGRLVFSVEQPNVPGVTVKEGLFIETKPLTAVWTGDGDRAKVNDPANWSCTDAVGDVWAGAPTADHTVEIGGTTTFNCPTGQTLTCKAIVLTGDVTLDADCDWRGLGSLPIPAGVTIDVAGHRFYLSDLKGTTTSTITDTVGGGEFHLDLAEDVTLTNTTVVLAGKLKFVKEGAGHYCSARAHSYTGGSYIAAGTASLLPSPSNNDTKYSPWAMKTFGVIPEGVLLTVGTGAKFEASGNYAMQTYRLGLEEGGTFSSSVNDLKDLNGKGGWGPLTLFGDADIALKNTIYFGGGGTKGDIKLNRHTLTITFGDGVSGKLCQLQNTTVSDGTLAVVGQGNWLTLENPNNLRTANLRLSCALRVSAAANVTDYEANCDRDLNAGTAALNVYGRFAPLTDYFYGCTLQNGATLDLTSRTGAWTTQGAFTSGASTVAFAANATVTVLVDGREDLASGMKLVDFSSNVGTDVKFVLGGTASATWMLDRRADGLYLEPVVKRASWTGAADDGDVMNRANWNCFDANGNPVQNGRPGSVTAVTIAGNVAFDAPIGTLFSCASLTIDNVTLTNDCDWSGLPKFEKAQSVDLHGHKLTISPHGYDYFGVSSGSTFTDTLPTGEGGELHVYMPNGVNMSADYNTGGNFKLTGSLQLVKEGDGMFTILGKNTYTGGTMVNGGTLRAYNDTAEAYYALCYYNDFGKPDTTITVNSNGVFDVHGVYEAAQYHIVLNGGALTSSLAGNGAGMSNYGNGAIGPVTLTADSKITIPGSNNHLHFNRPPNYGNLGGHTLTVEIGSGSFFTGTDYAFTNGTINIISGGWFRPRGSAKTWTDTDIVCRAALYLETDITVRDFSISDNSKYGAGHVIITGKYTPISTFVYNMTLADGATLDLSGVAGLPWTWLPLGTVAGATYDVELPEGAWLKSGDRVVKWEKDAPPANIGRIHFNAAKGVHGTFAVAGDGLYLRRGGMILIR